MFLLDLIFPRFCLGCQREGTWLCRSCFLLLATLPGLHCFDCQQPTSTGRFCYDHQANHSLQGILYANSFKIPLVRELIHNLKFNGIRELAQPLGILLGQRLLTWQAVCSTDTVSSAASLLLPLPLHAKRRAERGYNQAELLAERLRVSPSFLSQGLIQPSIIHDRLIEKYRSTTSQATLNRTDRLFNLKNAFRLRPELAQLANGQTIILVDDVATTGSTLEAVGQILCQAGARAVWGLVVAKD